MRMTMVDVCQICGKRVYLDDAPIDSERWSPGGAKEEIRPPVAEQKVVRVVGSERSNDEREGVGAMADKKFSDCAMCKELKKITARGLCGACWARAKKAGTLDNYGLSRKPTQKDQGQRTSVAEQPLPPGRVETLRHSADDTVVSLASMFAEELTDRDQAVLREVIESAAQNRRTPANEVLYRIEELKRIQGDAA